MADMWPDSWCPSCRRRTRAGAIHFCQPAAREDKPGAVADPNSYATHPRMADTLRERLIALFLPYCEDVKRATGDVCLAPELLADMTLDFVRAERRRFAEKVLSCQERDFQINEYGRSNTLAEIEHRFACEFHEAIAAAEAEE